jgi:hypothetical protein
MLKRVSPMSNVERQRKFRMAHPEYDRLRKARARAGAAAGAKALSVRLAAEAAERAAMASADVAAASEAEPTSEGPQLLLFPAMRPAA